MPAATAHIITGFIGAGYWTRISRDTAIARVKAVDCRAILYSVDCPIPIMLQRALARSEALPDDEDYVTVDGETLAYKPVEP